MAQDPYDPCHCGSGKKFKWCCQPIFVHINRAWEQEASGQHETAMRLMDEVVREHDGNPEAWGQKARLLYLQGKTEDADIALQKAFDLNPNYPAGLVLRATFRYQENEIPGALLLARRAAEAFDPDAREALADVYSLVFQCELQMNRPVAARAALRMAARFAPEVEELKKTFDDLFNTEGRFPLAARREYAFRKPASGPGAEAKRAAWDRALRVADTPRLNDLVRLFEPLTKEDTSDAAAWFNLGLSHAWLGDNRAAIEALTRFVDLETDEMAAGDAAALMEVLRCGKGQEEDGDYREYVFVFPFRDPKPIVSLVEEWERGRRLIVMESPQEGMFLAMLMELSSSGIITVGAPPSDVGRLAGSVLIYNGLFQFTTSLKEPFERTRDEVRQTLALGLTDIKERHLPMQFSSVTDEALLHPIKRGLDIAQLLVENIQKHYEETWINKPRRSLNGNTPLDAAAHPILRKHLRGVLQFVQDCAQGSMVAAYDFDRLRRKLGLLDGATQQVSLSNEPNRPAGSPDQHTELDFAAMSVAEIATLNAISLSDAQLERAFQAALKLDAEELAENFARTAIARPIEAEQTDRYTWYSYLIRFSLKEGDKDAALDYVNEGEKIDCEHNQGRRRDDYELRRAQVHAKRGEVEQSADVFQRLIERVPNNFRYRGTAAESMLSLRQGALALRFAEAGIAAAVQANDRDSVQYLQELAAAAIKQLA